MTASPSPTSGSARRVQAALRRAQKDGTEITVASIATAARVDRTFIYRRPELLAAIHAHHTPGLTGDDRYDRQHKINLSANLETLINETRGDTPLGQWVRDAVVERLARELGTAVEDLDGARRPAPRRANYKERAAKEKM
jgi:hypothetical protein